MNREPLVGAELLDWVLAGLVAASGRHDGQPRAEVRPGTFEAVDWRVEVHPHAAHHLEVLAPWGTWENRWCWVDGRGEVWSVAATGWNHPDDLVQVYRSEQYEHDHISVWRGPLVCASRHVHWGGGEPLALEVYDSLRRQGMEPRLAWSSARAIVRDGA